MLKDARQLRDRSLEALTRVIDGYLRSPVFLMWMRYGLAATFEAQGLHARGLGGLLPRSGNVRRRRQRAS